MLFQIITVSHIYHPYFSHNLVHEQAFVYLVLTEMLLSTNIKPGTTIIIGSDNGTSQYKSANNFFDLLCLADHYECIIIHIYGVAGHGGNAVDTAGGVAKTAIRNAVA